jgi:acetyl-CoA acetyltransferase family protein
LALNFGASTPVIVEAVRTPFGRRNGMLKDHHPAILASLVMTEALRRSGVRPADVEQVVWGCVSQVGDQGSNIGRVAWLSAGYPVETPATTVDVRCGSSQQAIHFAANLIATGTCDVVLAGGVESMSRVPLGSASHVNGGEPWPAEYRERFDVVPQGISAELVARKYGIDRTAMDKFSVQSHRRADEASNKGILRSQLVPIPSVNGGGNLPVRDEGIRPDTSFEAVSQLKPAFDPTHNITAGNSSQVTDGAAAVLLMSMERARQLGVEPRARVVAQAVVGVDPVLMLEGPIPATAAVLKRAGLNLSDMDLYEVNEAFASVPLAWLKVTGGDESRLNPNGGAIAIGHPLGASGARLMCHLLYELERRNLRFGLEAMCCGGGIGTATVIDREVGA